MVFWADRMSKRQNGPEGPECHIYSALAPDQVQRALDLVGQVEPRGEDLRVAAVHPEIVVRLL